MGRQAGYTIVEVTLFLALTGLLVMVVLIGFGGTIDNNRKTDSTRSLESAIEQGYSSVRSGVASRPTDQHGKALCGSQETYPGASDTCLVLGQLLRFSTGTSSKIRFYNIVSNHRPDAGCSTSGIMGIACYHPRVLDMSTPVDEYTPSWQARIKMVVFKSNIGEFYRTPEFIAILRHPDSDVIYLNPLAAVGVPEDLDNFKILSNEGGYYASYPAVIENYTSAKGQICLEHDGVGQKSYVRFNGGEGVGAVDMSDTPLLTAAGAQCP